MDATTSRINAIIGQEPVLDALYGAVLDLGDSRTWYACCLAFRPFGLYSCRPRIQEETSEIFELVEWNRRWIELEHKSHRVFGESEQLRAEFEGAAYWDDEMHEKYNHSRDQIEQLAVEIEGMTRYNKRASVIVTRACARYVQINSP